MRITIEQYGNRVMMETPNDDLLIDDLVEELKCLCLAIGYQPNSVARAFNECACGEDYPPDEEENHPECTRDKDMEAWYRDKDREAWDGVYPEAPE